MSTWKIGIGTCINNKRGVGKESRLLLEVLSLDGVQNFNKKK